MKKTFKKYYMILILLLSMVIVSTVILLKMVYKNTATEIYIELMETTVSDSELLELCDIIVQGECTGKVDEIIYVNENVQALVSIYSFDITECYYGEVDKSETILISFGGTALPSDIAMSTDTIVYLKENALDYKGEKVYSFASISQGVFLKESNFENSDGQRWTPERINNLEKE